MNATEITTEEFLSLASRDKVLLIDTLAARLLELADRFAQKSWEYHHGGGRYGKGEGHELVSAEYHKLEVQYDALGKAISSLQSTLKIERLGVYREP